MLNIKRTPMKSVIGCLTLSGLFPLQHNSMWEQIWNVKIPRNEYTENDVMLIVDTRLSPNMTVP